MISLYSHAHPFIGVFFLLVSGLCDAFDGKVARSKKNRTEMEKKFGIQIDSLADMVSFGVLPACIGSAMMRVVLQNYEAGDPTGADKLLSHPYFFICYAVIILYILAALIRLAYFNVAEEERQKTEGGVRKYYEGLPVTSAALIFPTVLLFQYVLPKDITWIYFLAMAVTGFLFISKIPVKKPGYQGHSGNGRNRRHRIHHLIATWMYYEGRERYAEILISDDAGTMHPEAADPPGLIPLRGPLHGFRHFPSHHSSLHPQKQHRYERVSGRGVRLFQ